jgi:hypothetical protein
MDCSRRNRGFRRRTFACAMSNEDVQWPRVAEESAETWGFGVRHQWREAVVAWSKKSCCRRSGQIGGLFRRVQRTEVSRENPQIPPTKTVPVIRSACSKHSALWTSPLCRRCAFVPNWINQDAHAFNFNQRGGVPEASNAQAGLWVCRTNSWIGMKGAQRMPRRPRRCSERETRAQILTMSESPPTLVGTGLTDRLPSRSAGRRAIVI